jgi:hypothetical protein
MSTGSNIKSKVVLTTAIRVQIKCLHRQARRAAFNPAACITISPSKHRAQNSLPSGAAMMSWCDLWLHENYIHFSSRLPLSTSQVSSALTI